MFPSRSANRGLGVLTALVLLLSGGSLLASPADASTCKTVRPTSIRTIETCYSVPQATTRTWRIAYQDGVENRLTQAVTGSCTTTKSTTYSYGLSVTLGAEVSAWVFNKISASVTGTLSKSTTTGYGITTTFPVPARSTVHCQRGAYSQGLRTQRTITTREYTNNAHTVLKSSRSEKRWITGSAPTPALWRLVSG